MSNSFDYSHWSSTKHRVYKLQPLCTNNFLHGKASVVHHLKYKRSPLRRLLEMLLLRFPRKSVAGYEIPGWDVVTVCNRCHQNYMGRSEYKSSLHHSSVWIQKGGLDNHQSRLKMWELRIKFLGLAILHGVGL